MAKVKITNIREDKGVIWAPECKTLPCGEDAIVEGTDYIKELADRKFIKVEKVTQAAEDK